MANITAAEVNKLRKMTGAGMMDCKKALVETEGDFEKAIDLLRKKGQKVASKRADKEANEGIVLAQTTADNKYGVVFMLNCETDFVAKNDEFVNFANGIMEKALSEKPASVEDLKALKLNDRTVEENITEMVGKTGEKMDLSGFEVIEAEKVFAYNHMGNKLATVLGLNKANGVDEAGHQLAMQVAAMAPVAVDRGDVPQEVIDKELEIGREQAREEGKPEAMLDKIAEGKLNKFFKENTLLNQDFVRDSKKTVAQFLKEVDGDLKVTGFKRLMLGA
ncbi:MAG TPA: translation elongation factor Ts [Bacteroidales bacterium]|nr:translation elongation factor Ts [Bacteroidales bacterium]HRX96811.1 translation elongation factor Ts [Bacteroidales bacterium]